MTRPKQGELKFGGINRDKVPGDVDPSWWTDGRNVIMLAGETVRVDGEAKFANTGRLFPAQFVHYVDTGVQAWWVYGGDAGIAATDGTTHYNITPAGWGPIASKNWVYTVGDLNTLPFVNHPERGPFWWNGNPASVMAALPGWPSGQSCMVMRAHKNFLLAGNIDTPGPGRLENQVNWSSSAAPGTVPAEWVPSPTNDAGDYTFASPGGPIMDLLDVRDQVIVGKQNSFHVLQYVGGQYVFEGRDLFPSHGLLATGAWIEAGNRITLVSSANIVMWTDTTSIAPVLHGVLQKYFEKQLNREYPSSVFCYRNDALNQVMIAYPVGTSKACTEAIALELGTWLPGIRDLPGVFGCSIGVTAIVPQTWDSDHTSWDSDVTTWNESGSGYVPPHIVFAGGANGLIEQGAATTQIDPATGNARPMFAYVERSGIDYDDLEYRKLISGLVPRVQGNAGDTLTFKIGAQDSDSGLMEIYTCPPFVIGTDSQADVDVDGRLGMVHVESTGGSPWKIASLFPSARRSGRW